MSNCIICNNRGYVYNTKGNITLCRCRFHDNWLKYLEAVKGLIPLSIKDNIKYSKIIDSNQVITNINDNVASLLKLMISDWFPEEYVITSIEEINAICFERHDVYKSINEFASSFKYFIVDMTIINKLRAKSDGWNSKDSMCLLDLIKMIIPTSQKIVILIKPGIAEFVKQFHELCTGLNDFGIKYFHTGTYKMFPTENNLKGADNE